MKMPYFYYFVSWAVVIFAQIVVASRISVSGIYPDFVVAIVVLLGLKRNWRMAMWFGFLFGFTLDILNPVGFGWQTLIVSLSGALAGVVREKINVESGFYQVCIVAIIAFLNNIVLPLVETAEFFLSDFRDYLTDSMLIAVYTALVSAIILIILKQRYRLREFL